MIKIETEAGRIEYLKAQETIFKKGVPVRERLIGEVKKLLEYVI